MAQQYIYTGASGKQLYTKNTLNQYNTSTNPLDPLGLQGAQYTLGDQTNYTQNYISAQNNNQPYSLPIAYGQPIQNNINYNKAQLYQQHIPHQQQKIQNVQPQLNKPQTQLPIKQNPQINAKNNMNQIQYQQNIHQKERTQIQYPNHNQIQAPINPKPQQINQTQFQNNPKQIIQPQKNPQAKINPQIQPQQNKQGIAQNQIKGLTSEQIHYQQYIQNIYQNQNQNQNINIQYNKNDEHFVNKPIYQNRIIPTNNIQLQNQQNQIKTLQNNQNIVKDNKMINNKNVPQISQKPPELISNPNFKKLSTIKEEEMDIKQSGLSHKISQISNQDEITKEIPMEEKTPEIALPENKIENINQENENINEKSLTQSGVSDYDINLSHLPTINSIMKGKSEPLPPQKKNKYSK